MALIYIVEDDTSIREIETIALKNSNYIVQAFGDAASFYKQIEIMIPDLVLLDIMLPDEDGYEIVRKLRNNAHTSRIPVIMVSAKSTEIDMVKGLDDGADDYIKKPFSIMELLSRVKAMLRRTQKEEVHSLSVGKVTVDVDKHIVTSCGDTVELTYKEFQLLRYLMINEGVVLSRESIMQQVWDTDFEGETRTVDMHIKTLRQKLGEGSSIIKTIRNVGYVVQSEE
ncbi:MAG: response regulator transcription factor [Bacillota bacterium]|nr:response regulator transcription factor [Bacillota bacterium]